MMHFIIALIPLIFLSLSPALAQDKTDWSKIDRIGLYQTADDGQMTPDIWKDYSQERAIGLINQLPNRLTNPEYRTLAKKLLLSESKATKSPIESPALLSARLNKLISYGLFDETNQLYQKAMGNIGDATDFDLSLIDIQMSLTNGNLAPVCLDIQAESNYFRDMPAWSELSNFCLHRFGSSNKIKLDSLSFQAMPALGHLLKNDSIDIREPKTNIGTLIAFADNKISPESYNDAARMTGILDDLKIKLALDKRFSNQETYQCYAIEAAKRGIINAKDLEMTYQSASFSNETLNSMTGSVTLHPCTIPAFFYQRLKITQSPEEITKNVDTMLSVTRNIPAIALTPMAKDIEVHAAPEHQWRSAIILGLSGITIPDSYASSVWPLKLVQQTNQISKNNYEEWLDDEIHKELLEQTSLDLAVPLYISTALSSDLTNLGRNSEKIEYENIFSLTYARNSLHLGLGFYDYIRRAYDKKDTASVVSTILSAAGLHDIKNMNPRDVSVILSSFMAYKLDKEAVNIALEYLQY